MIKLMKWTDQELEEWNDGTAVLGNGDYTSSISNNSLNALICEVQAWRRFNKKHKFLGGPNKIVEKEE